MAKISKEKMAWVNSLQEKQPVVFSGITMIVERNTNNKLYIRCGSRLRILSKVNDEICELDKLFSYEKLVEESIHKIMLKYMKRFDWGGLTPNELMSAYEKVTQIILSRGKR